MSIIDFSVYFRYCLAMAEKKIFSTRLDAEVIKDLKHLAVDLEKSLGNLLEEAIEDLVLKYRGREEQ